MQQQHNPRIRSHSQAIMTTPLPPTKKSKQTGGGSSVLAPDYSRKKKSLGVLAETFCSRHDGCRKDTEIVVDTLAKELVRLCLVSFPGLCRRGFFVLPFFPSRHASHSLLSILYIPPMSGYLYIGG
jgi:hypothetical protein